MGVKQLWTLLGPVGRPVLLETMEGKALAIDSSIWIYQFQATMRDKEGRGLNNAHVLGFLRRICKLLFYGIKPVFVFDGGAPALKRSTITERKRRKAGAAQSHARVAEKLLAAQLRREAISHVKKRQAAQHHSAEPLASGERGSIINENTVYWDDLVSSSDQPVPKIPPQPDNQRDGKTKEPPPPSVSPKKHAWRDHDPYKLPEVDLSAQVAAAVQPIDEDGQSKAVDPRLATEEELRHFIETMRPEDFDASSPAFRELPTEVQYEIIGDLRLKSRQTSYSRLQQMLKSSKSAMDFSKAQIRGLRARNKLTQDLLLTTNTMGKEIDHHIFIPVRIAAERNREYVLIKNEGPSGGWSLGIRDEGTKEKPIQVQPDSDDDEDMEEVVVNEAWAQHANTSNVRKMPFVSITTTEATHTERHSPVPANIKSPSGTSEKPKEPLFTSWNEIDSDHIDDESEFDLTKAIEASWKDQEDQEDKDFQEALLESRQTIIGDIGLQSDGAGPSSSTSNFNNRLETITEREKYEDSDDDDDLQIAIAASVTEFKPTLKPSNLEQKRAVAISVQPNSADTEAVIDSKISLAATNPRLGSRPSFNQVNEAPKASAAWASVNISASRFFSVSPSPPSSPKQLDQPNAIGVHSQSVQKPVTAAHAHAHAVYSPPRSLPDQLPSPILSTSAHRPFQDLEEEAKATSVDFGLPEEELSLKPEAPIPASQVEMDVDEDEDEDDMEEEDLGFGLSDDLPELSTAILAGQLPGQNSKNEAEAPGLGHDASRHEGTSVDEGVKPSFTGPLDVVIDESPAEDEHDNTMHVDQTNDPEEEDWDAANEMDVQEEENEFAQFVSEVKGKDLNTVRDEIEQEIAQLHKEKKAHQRDSDEITHQMVGQIMMLLRLFGIPYITAPMEAEAQCAALLSLGLIEGVITDDSDVFLFGATRVYKNMFNQSKTVECFLASDLQKELALDRERLVMLAYLLGSDYVGGLEGVGPVVAMEILKEFDSPDHPGDGLHRFKEWWIKVQMGKDKEAESQSDFKKRFKKKYKNLHISGEWPNPAVRDAYYHPTVDESEEAFKWGLPDLDALRTFLGEELHWSQTKVDDLLLPIIRKMGQRSRSINANRQGTLSGYFDASIGSGTLAPRQRQTYASKRLQKVVSDFRKARDANRESTPSKGGRKPKAKAKTKAGEAGYLPSAEDAGADFEQDRDSQEEEGPNEGEKVSTKGTRKRTKAGSGKTKRVVKKRKVEDEGEDSIGAEEKDEDNKMDAVPDRPLGVQLRARKGKKVAAVIEDSDGNSE